MNIKERIKKLNLPSTGEAVGAAIMGLALYPTYKSVAASAIIAGSIYGAHALMSPKHLNIFRKIDKFYDALGNTIEPIKY